MRDSSSLLNNIGQPYYSIGPEDNSLGRDGAFIYNTANNVSNREKSWVVVNFN